MGEFDADVVGMGGGFAPWADAWEKVDVVAGLCVQLSEYFYCPVRQWDGKGCLVFMSAAGMCHNRAVRSMSCQRAESSADGRGRSGRQAAAGAGVRVQVVGGLEVR